jgi:hypothetical protein
LVGWFGVLASLFGNGPRLDHWGRGGLEPRRDAQVVSTVTIGVSLGAATAAERSLVTMTRSTPSRSGTPASPEPAALKLKADE